MTDAPSITQQADAVEWAKAHARETGKRAKMRNGEIDEIAPSA